MARVQHKCMAEVKNNAGSGTKISTKIEENMITLMMSITIVMFVRMNRY